MKSVHTTERFKQRTRWSYNSIYLKSVTLNSKVA